MKNREIMYEIESPLESHLNIIQNLYDTSTSPFEKWRKQREAVMKRERYKRFLDEQEKKIARDIAREAIKCVDDVVKEFRK